MTTLTDADRSTLKAIEAAAMGGDLPRAVALAEAALSAGLDHPFVLNLAALGREEAGRLDEARALLERAVRAAPEDPSAWNALGLIRMRLDLPAEALTAFERVLTLAPSQPFAHVNRANALKDLGAYALAEQGFEAALALDPRHPVALAGRAMVASARGDHAEARARGLAALAQRPDYPDAVLSVAAAELAASELEPAERRLRALAASPALGPLELARVEGLIGDVQDARGATTEAYATYVRANARLQAVYASRYLGERSALAYLHAASAALDRAEPADWRRRAPPSGAVGHVFLLGFPRSGTTLLEVVLDGNPAIASLEEQELLIDGVQRYLGNPADLSELAQASEQELDTYRDAYWEAAMRRGVDLAGKVFVDKYPLNTLKLPLIARLFPDARIIFAVRDPRDVVLSAFRRQFRMSAPMYELLTLEGTATYYDAVMRYADRCIRLLGLSMLEVHHEDLVADFRGQLDGICRFLGLPWHDAMMEFAPRSKTRPRATPSTAQLARGLDQKTVGQWRRYANELSGVLPLLNPWVERFGYPED
jgi:tetratricopeptide (TPR) repeat protein